MAGNTFGKLFCVSSFGESHGPAIGCIVDGCPPGIPLSEENIQHDLARRRPGSSRHVTQRREPDTVEILSGVFDGHTTGVPIGLLIRNVDAKSHDYDDLRDLFRPGHADYTYFKKYGRRDHRGSGRASARETATRVAAGAIARLVLKNFGVTVHGRLMRLGNIEVPFESWEKTAHNPFFAANDSAVPAMEEKITQLRRDGDSCGAVVEVVSTGMAAGWGEPVFDRLDADIAKALMSINAVKGVEIGDGFAAAAQTGSVHGDEMTAAGFASNHAGGVLGGISTGQDIVARLAIKPTSSIRLPRRTLNKKDEETTVSTLGRHDPCVGIRAVPVAEAMLALTLVDHALRHRGQCGNLLITSRYNS
ncbi:chorismate synthase [Candidatus Persebacteraceae bacterium Df01]|jgi:chorismate synthase|uniref:Chorismate synthase n=1 Tax=Candidatus Doriopsillibacter californiensis TaxID=2970740 RepID=A0ABT7QJT2_9GAMM|nr:chorismate synthase [Candidatus Persebacteraceae bacterium Df01]